MASEPLQIRPQPGPQEAFLSSEADIAIYGGAAGGGKSWALLLEPLRHIYNKLFAAVIFRRTLADAKKPGATWTQMTRIYPLMMASARLDVLEWTFPAGAKIAVGHLEHESTVYDWQSAELPLICFDELTHFSRAMFFYMMSRNRSMSGVRPYMRATCNPDADSWVAELIAWWIDQQTGYPIPERAGVLRWFIRVGDELRWADSPAELARQYGVPESDAKSLTFIPAKLSDNAALMAANPEYEANLRALSLVERSRLLDGNWKIRPAAGLYFARHDVRKIQTLPADIVKWARGWDLAATTPSEENPDPDWTAGPLLGMRAGGGIVVADVARVRRRANEVRLLVKRTAESDGRKARIVIPKEPGQAGKEQSESYVRELKGFIVSRFDQTQNKVVRAEPFASQWQAGNVEVLDRPWTEAYLAELERFPDGAHDDQVDGSAAAFHELTTTSTEYAGSMRGAFR